MMINKTSGSNQESQIIEEIREISIDCYCLRIRRLRVVRDMYARDGNWWPWSLKRGYVFIESILSTLY